MTSLSRRVSHTRRLKPLNWAASLALGASVVPMTQAATVGHSRAVSAPGAPLQVVIPLDGLTPEEAASLQVRVADADAWRRAGLQPPVPLDTMRVTIRDVQRQAAR